MGELLQVMWECRNRACSGWCYSYARSGGMAKFKEQDSLHWVIFLRNSAMLYSFHKVRFCRFRHAYEASLYLSMICLHFFFLFKYSLSELFMLITYCLQEILLNSHMLIGPRERFLTGFLSLCLFLKNKLALQSWSQKKRSIYRS